MEISKDEGGKHIRYIIDKHPLVLMEQEAVECVLCHEDIHGPAYGCPSCMFYIHKSCDKLEQKSLKPPDPIHGITLKHFGHEHPLTLLLLQSGNCRICKKRIRGPRYGCDLCLCYVHKSCGELQQKISHPLHLAHFLRLRKYGSHVCDACRLKAEGFSYRCAACGFCLHLECLSVKPNIKYEGHNHLLILVENMSDESQCEACGSEIKGTFFLRCVQCSINFHVQCDTHQLPRTIANKLHQHPLALVTETPVKSDCASCREEIDPKNPSYFCVKCDYYAHVRCVVTELKFGKKIKCFIHEDSLILTEKIDDISCYVCEEIIQGTAYGCGSCSVYLHKSCVKFPRKARHHFHRHFLALQKPDSEVDRECKACHKFFNGFSYRCNDCNFDLDLDCVLLQPSIKYEGHDEHILTFFEKLDYAPKCRACSRTPPEASYLRCVICNFNIHLMCSPLPKTIEHGSHPPHPLALRDRFVDNNYDMQICDVCETKSDPRECVYYCAECDFIAGFDCAIPEVIQYLEGERADVQLKTVNGDEEDRERLTLGDIFDSCTEEELQEMLNIERKLEGYIDKMLEGDTGTGTGTEANKVGISENLVHSEANFAHYIARLIKNSQKKPSKLDFINMKDKVVNDGNYKIPQKLASVLKKLLDKRKDFTSNCTFTTQNPKAILLARFCSAVQSMCHTKIMYVTDSLICKWWYQFKFVQLGGFKIDFALIHLREIEHARRRRNFKTCRNTPLYRLNEKMAEFSGEIDKLSQKIDNLNAVMEKIRSEKLEWISGYTSDASRSEAKCLDEDLELAMKHAGTGLL